MFNLEGFGYLLITYARSPPDNEKASHPIQTPRVC